jgi:acylphosphatase
MSCICCLVSGRVQGVWFRETTRRKAAELGLEGQALNLPDGRVEVTVCGEESALEVLQEWLWEGSPLSRVDDVQCKELTAPASFNGFHTG